MKRISMDRGWRFYPEPDRITTMEAFRKEGQEVELPHDAMILRDVSPKASNGRNTGFYEGSAVLYTKELDFTQVQEGRRYVLEFDGAYMNAEVSLNGRLLGVQHNGYFPFHVDLTPYLHYGEKNSLSVFANNSAQRTERWYTGTGLYRHVDLLTGPGVHLSPWPVYARTDHVTSGDASVWVEVTAENHTGRDCVRRAEIRLKDEAGKTEAAGSAVLSIPARGKASARAQILVENARLWDIDSPELYRVEVVLCEEDGTETDSAETLFGIRTVTVDSKYGLRLNGRSIKLKGGCIHCDNGLLGGASFYDSEYRKCRLHKEKGFNALRFAHNPVSRDMLEACDRVGLLVIDEAFDVWKIKKNDNDYHLYFRTEWKQDLERMLLRDRNHPCVFMWSVGNEVTDRYGLCGGYQTAEMLAAFVRSMDPFRPVTASMPVPFNGLEDGEMRKSMEALAKEMGQEGMPVQNLASEYGIRILSRKAAPFLSSFDVASYNYLEQLYEQEGETNPGRIICGTESFPDQIDVIWDKVERLPYVIGDFTWTSYDYIGEAGIGVCIYTEETGEEGQGQFPGMDIRYPWRLAFDADFDLCGFDRPQLHYRSCVWGSRETYIAVCDPADYGKKEVKSQWGWTKCRNDWDCPGAEGKPVKVEVYSAAPEVELLLNGRSLGRKKAGKENRYKAVFDTVYEPGTLTAVSLEDGQEVSGQTLVTPGEPVRLGIRLERDSMKADGQSLVFGTVEILDRNGRRVWNRDRKLHISLEGGGAALAAFGTGQPVTEENYTAGAFTSYEGRAQFILRAGREPGEIEAHVRGDGLEEAAAAVHIHS